MVSKRKNKREMFIPNEILLDYVAPYLQLSDKTRMTAVSRFFHHQFKRQDHGKDFPRALKVITIWDEFSDGGFDPLHGDDLFKALSSFPFLMETCTPVSVGIRTWEPVIDINIDLSETFFRQEDRSVVKGIQYSFQFLDELFGSRVKIEVTKLSVLAMNNDPTYLIGFCETQRQKSQVLFGVKHDQTYEITTALTSTKIYPPPILQFQSVFLEDQRLEDLWENIQPEPVVIRMFGVQRHDDNGF